MIIKNDWNPGLYLKFNTERIQPSIDLVSRIKIDRRENIIDIGCGPGNSTQILVQKWPDSKITGVDNSPAMIEKAKKDYPNQNWVQLDAGRDEISGTYDLIFSNSTIQWILNHAELLKKFYSILNEKGILAIQLPLFWDMPVGKDIKRIARDSRWKFKTKNVTELFTIHNYSYYFDQLSQLYSSVDIWETNYMHIMDTHTSILEMISSTGLRPFLDKLDNEKDKKDFEEQLLLEIKRDYPEQINGKVIFPFKRLFFIASK